MKHDRLERAIRQFHGPENADLRRRLRVLCEATKNGDACGVLDIQVALTHMGRVKLEAVERALREEIRETEVIE